MRYLNLNNENKIIAVSNYPVFEKMIEVEDSVIDSFNPDGDLYFIDGVISQVPSVVEHIKPTYLSMAQTRITLLHYGKLQDVVSLIQNMPGPEGEQARIEWEFRTGVDRNHTLVNLIQQQFGWSNEFIDEMFEYGASR